MAVFIVIIICDLDEEDFNLDYPISQASVLLFKKETSMDSGIIEDSKGEHNHPPNPQKLMAQL